MAGLNKGFQKVDVTLRWDPSPMGAPPHDLDIIAATYTADDPYGAPAYLVHFDSRSPDGTITLNRDSRTGLGFGADEVMLLELYRLAARYTRVVVGIAIQQQHGHKTFGDVPHTHVLVKEGVAELTQNDFAELSGATAATLVEFLRNDVGAWQMREIVRGFDTDPTSFAELMGAQHS